MAETATTEEVEVETPEEEPSGNQQDEFVARLSKVYQKLKRSKKLNVAMKEVEQELLDLLGVRLFTIWQSVDNGSDISASFRGGDPDDDGPVEIKVPSVLLHLPVM